MIEVHLHWIEAHQEWEAVHLSEESAGHRSERTGVEVHYALIGMALIVGRIEGTFQRLSVPRSPY